MKRRRAPGDGYPAHLATFDPDLWRGPLLEGERNEHVLPAGDLTAKDLQYLARQRWLMARFEWAKAHDLDVLPELRERMATRREYLGWPRLPSARR